LLDVFFKRLTRDRFHFGTSKMRASRCGLPGIRSPLRAMLP
jgi:hypothetical protein